MRRRSHLSPGWRFHYPGKPAAITAISVRAGMQKLAATRTLHGCGDKLHGVTISPVQMVKALPNGPLRRSGTPIELCVAQFPGQCVGMAANVVELADDVAKLIIKVSR